MQTLQPSELKFKIMSDN